MIQHVTDPDSLAKIFDEILQPSFPPSELIGKKEFLEAAVASRFDVLGAFEDDVCTGVIVGERYDGAILVVWLAVGGSTRASGTGSALVEAGLERWIELPGTQLVLGEVERPDLFDVHPEHGDPERRLAFYSKFGAGALEVPYFQPPIARDMPRVPGLLLVTLAAKNSDPLPRVLNPAETDAVRNYLESVMDRTNKDDAQTTAVFAAIDNPEGIRLHRLEDYAEIPLPPGVNPQG